MKGLDADPGHADRFETSVLLALEEDHIRLSELPPEPTPLVYRETGIVDAAAFDGSPADRFHLPAEHDPRRSSREEGEALVKREVEACAARVGELLGDAAAH